MKDCRRMSDFSSNDLSGQHGNTAAWQYRSMPTTEFRCYGVGMAGEMTIYL